MTTCFALQTLQVISFDLKYCYFLPLVHHHDTVYQPVFDSLHHTHELWTHEICSSVAVIRKDCYLMQIRTLCNVLIKISWQCQSSSSYDSYIFLASIRSLFGFLLTVPSSWDSFTFPVSQPTDNANTKIITSIEPGLIEPDFNSEITPAFIILSWKLCRALAKNLIRTDLPIPE